MNDNLFIYNLGFRQDLACFTLKSNSSKKYLAADGTNELKVETLVKGKEEQIWCLQNGFLTNKKGEWTSTDKWSVPGNGPSHQVKRTRTVDKKKFNEVLEVGMSDTDTKVTYQIENMPKSDHQQWLRQDIGDIVCFTLRNEYINLGPFRYLTAVSKDELNVEILKDGTR